MKKQIKRFAACLASAIMLQTAAVIPADAAVPTVSGTDFESNCSYTVPAEEKDFMIGKAFYVKKGEGIIKEPVYGEDGETITGYKTDSVSIVNDQNPAYPGDKAFKIKRGEREKTNSQNFYRYTPSEGVFVWEFDIMFDQPIHNFIAMMQLSDWKELRLFSTVSDQGKLSIRDKVTNTHKTYASLNEWHHVKTVFDFRDKKESNGAQILDFSKNNISVYFDDVVIHDKTPVTTFNPKAVDGTIPKTFLIVCNTTSNDHNIYLDNYYSYLIGENDETSFELKAGGDYRDASFMNGKIFKFWAESAMGADTGYSPVNKVVWYLDGEEKATATAYPFSFECTPTTAGTHTVACEAFTKNDTEAFAYDEMSFYVEPKFREEVLVKEDFNSYTDGTTKWDDKSGNGYWQILNTTEENGPKAVEVDSEHGKSLNLGTNNARRIDGMLNSDNYIYNGIIKASAEIYANGFIGNNNVLLSLRSEKDVNSLNLHNAKVLLNRQSGNKQLAQLSEMTWHKIDWVTTIKDGVGYHSVYVDGKRVEQTEYVNPLSVKSLKGVIFASLTNTAGNLYFDNLSISKIEYYDNTGFWCGDVPVQSLAAMPGTVLTAKTAVANKYETQQYMAVYDKDTNELKKLAVGSYDETTGIFTVNCDLSGMENVYVKVFVWDEMRPALSTPEFIE